MIPPPTVAKKILLNSRQYEFFHGDKNAELFVGGVGSGKTFVGARKAVNRAHSNPATVGLIAANTQTQLDQSTLPEFFRALQELGYEEGVDYVFDKLPPRSWGLQSKFQRHNAVISIKTHDGHLAQLVTRSLHDWQPILGLTLGWAWLDEARDTKRDAFYAVLSRLRCPAEPNPQVFITTTPNGFDWLQRYFDAEPAKDPALSRLRRYHVARTQDNAVNLPPDYIVALESSYDPLLAKQELGGEWIDVFRGRAYYAFDRQKHLFDDLKYDPSLPVILSCDFNVSPMSWVIGQDKRCPNRDLYQDRVFDIFDEIRINATSTVEAIAEFKARGYPIEKTEVYGDSYGHSGTAGKTDYAVIRESGVNSVHAPRSNPPVVDRVASVNAKLTDSTGKIGIRIHPKCTALIEDLSRVGYKPGTRQLDKGNKELTHMSDALGYAVYALWPISRARSLRVAYEGRH